MATIDLRHLVEPEAKNILIKGSSDGIEYLVPLKKTVAGSLMLNQYFIDFNKTRDPEMPDFLINIELNYMMVTAWIRGFFPKLDIEWVKANVSVELFTELVRLLEPVFFPEQPKQEEAPKPTKKGKNRRS